MDETEHLLSSLHDHLDAGATKAESADAAMVLDEARSIADELATADVDRETAHERVEVVLNLLDGLEQRTDSEEARDHIEAARRAGERVLDR